MSINKIMPPWLERTAVIIAVLIIAAIPTFIIYNSWSGGKLFSACKYAQYALDQSIDVQSAYLSFSSGGIFTNLVIQPMSGDAYFIDVYPGDSENQADQFINEINKDVSLRKNVHMIYVPNSVNLFLGRSKNVIKIILSNGSMIDFCK